MFSHSDPIFFSKTERDLWKKIAAAVLIIVTYWGQDSWIWKFTGCFSNAAQNFSFWLSKEKAANFVVISPSYDELEKAKRRIRKYHVPDFDLNARINLDDPEETMKVRWAVLRNLCRFFKIRRNFDLQLRNRRLRWTDSIIFVHFLIWNCLEISPACSFLGDQWFLD